MSHPPRLIVLVIIIKLTNSRQRRPTKARSEQEKPKTKFMLHDRSPTSIVQNRRKRVLCGKKNIPKVACFVNLTPNKIENKIAEVGGKKE